MTNYDPRFEEGLRAYAQNSGRAVSAIKGAGGEIVRAQRAIAHLSDDPIEVVERAVARCESPPESRLVCALALVLLLDGWAVTFREHEGESRSALGSCWAELRPQSVAAERGWSRPYRPDLLVVGGRRAVGDRQRFTVDVEVDGEEHDEPGRGLRDVARDWYMQGRGISVCRLPVSLIGADVFRAACVARDVMSRASRGVARR